MRPARSRFSYRRLWAIIVKEFIQMRRDRMTFGMLVGIPIIQLLLFGYAINSDPKHLPTAVFDQDGGPQARSIVAALRNSRYYQIVTVLQRERDADELLARGQVQFVVSIPPNFTRDLLRGARPALLVEADATDPTATANAIGALNRLATTALQNDWKGALGYLAPQQPAFALRVHNRYNPDAIQEYNVVPGLMGVILTMTLTMITALAITRERERGTMENLLATPTRPSEVLIGKIVPYILVGYIQVSLILCASQLLFHVPMLGSIPLLLLVSLVFIAANLAVGVTFSTLAKNQLQAVQMTFFFFLPSLLLSGFMFPFRGMPHWAQNIGECLPLTHFLRIVRGILLKGNGFAQSGPELWPILLFATTMIFVSVKRYRQTLD